MRNVVRAYRESVVRGATPVGLVLILYEEVQRSLRNAARAIDQNNIEQRTLELSHAIHVVGHLQSVLDYEAGGRVALSLTRFYNVARAKILEASFRSDRAAIESLAADFAGLMEAWKQVDRDVNGDAAASPIPMGAAAEAARAIEQAAEEVSTGVRVEG